MPWNFWSKSNKCPITEEDREWLEEALFWYRDELGIEVFNGFKTLAPTITDFNWNFKGNEADARYVLRKLCSLMDININRLDLVIYAKPSTIEFSEGLHSVKGDYLSTAGRYVQHDTGLIDIMVEEKQLKSPITLIATIAHELMHVKLLGEKRIEDNDEYLTDLGVLVYEFGVFNANTAVTEMNTWSGVSHAGWQISGGDGYLHYKVQAFALALLANYRNERGQDWENFLHKEVKKYYEQSHRYIEANGEMIKFK